MATAELLSDGSGSYKTIGELSSLLLGSNDGSLSSQLLSEFVVPESSRPHLQYDASPSDRLPVLDLGAGTPDPDRTNRGRVAAKLTEICEQWGFVQVINHGVPSELIKKMASFGHSFFTLPTDQKERGAISYLNGYGAKQIHQLIGTPWVEGLTLTTSPESNIAAFEARMWPSNGDPSFRQMVSEFAGELEKLENIVLELLAEGLGLETTFFSQHFDHSKGITAGVHFNYYPPCPDPSKVLGALAHTDPSCLTILYQDKVTGLQIQAEDGSWHPIDRNPDGLLVFVGDILQGWSNGRFPAVVHRAVVNDKVPRLSFLHATSPAPNFVIQPVVDDNHPRRYKHFTYAGYMEFKSDIHLQLPDDARKPMEIYAGET